MEVMTKRITKGQRVRYRHFSDKDQKYGTVVHIEDPILWVRPDKKHEGLDVVTVYDVRVITGHFGSAEAPDREPSRRDLRGLSEGPADAEVRRVRQEQALKRARELSKSSDHVIGERPECVACDAPCVVDPTICPFAI